jgi:ABC-type transport system involved in multi-copper enzyme maturation permease subunit
MPDVGLLRDSFRSEWTKLWSVRSTYWTLFATLVLGVGFGALISWGAGHSFASDSPGDKATFDPTAVSLAGMFLGQLALGVMAIILMTSEYSTGSIRTTMSATPQRGYVLAAKTLIIATGGLLISAIVSFLAFFVGQAILSNYGLNVSLSNSTVLRAVVGSALYLAVLMLFALGLATLIRHTAGTITILVGIVFILPIFLPLLPDMWQHDLVRYLPSEAGRALISTVPGDNPSNTLPPWGGFAVFLAWAAALLGAGWLVLRRRDV